MLMNDGLLTLTTDPDFAYKGTVDRIYVDYHNITKVLTVGETVFIDDGLISLEVLEIGGDSLKTVVRSGGKLGSRKGVNLPTTEVGEFLTIGCERRNFSAVNSRYNEVISTVEPR